MRLQLTIIIGSSSLAAATGLFTSTMPGRLLTAAMSVAVASLAGWNLNYRPGEKADNLQSCADDLRAECRSVEYEVDDYASDEDDQARCAMFAHRMSRVLHHATQVQRTLNRPLDGSKHAAADLTGSSSGEST